MSKGNNKGTETSSFGSTERKNHDSSEFYDSELYSGRIPEEVEYEENKIDSDKLNNILCKSSENMSEIPDKSVHLMVTSPPYNVGKEYDEDLSLDDYLGLLERVFQETYRVLVPGGRTCINVANLGRKPYIPIHSYVIDIMNSLGFLMRGEVIWDKQNSGGTAWGSWKSASNPVLRDQHEYILIFSKGSMGRDNPQDREDTIKKEEFLEYTKSIWKFTSESAQKVGHPAPFPVELPRRCIQLFTFKGEIILDPFMGVGTTAIASIKSERDFVGYEINKEYANKAKKRIKKNNYIEKSLF